MDATFTISPNREWEEIKIVIPLTSIPRCDEIVHLDIIKGDNRMQRTVTVMSVGYDIEFNMDTGKSSMHPYIYAEDVRE